MHFRQFMSLYFVWTPVGTKVFLIDRDDKYLEMLQSYLYKFWTMASDDKEPKWHADVFVYACDCMNHHIIDGTLL
jgi:hypothetical protein